jgi:uncharacterized protein
MRRAILAAVAAFVLAAPATATAHVTLQPTTAPAGGFARLDVRVPNERDDKGTIKVDVRMPPGIVSASYEPVPGWTTTITKEKLSKPIKVEGLDVNQQIAQITWTGDGKQGVIKPGQFQDFGLSLAIPKGNPGSKLTFKALQTYQGGEIVRWIGPADADEPAPTVTLTAGGEGGGHGAPSTQSSAPAADTATTAATQPAGDSGSDTVSIVALIVGALGLIVGAAALILVRRPTSTRV